jgi:hypothetical protein
MSLLAVFLSNFSKESSLRDDDTNANGIVVDATTSSPKQFKPIEFSKKRQ